MKIKRLRWPTTCAVDWIRYCTTTKSDETEREDVVKEDILKFWTMPRGYVHRFVTNGE